MSKLKYNLNDLSVEEFPSHEEMMKGLEEIRKNRERDPDYYDKLYDDGKSIEEEFDECIRQHRLPGNLTPELFDLYQERVKVWQKENGLL